jgi:NAD(P)-dependent dehydrogenase (short-subunit alcohol dehydrogenase family)
LAREGCNVVVAAKSVSDQPNLPGTIYSVAKEAEQLGVNALPAQVDLRNEATIHACVDDVMKQFGKIDILINNASALWWQDIVDTPLKKYDLINGINAKGTFAMSQACLPHMLANKHGRVINMSPPIVTDLNAYLGKTAYFMSKFGMSMVALGVGAEGRGKGVTGNTLWPATVIESAAAKNFKLGSPSTWRKADILADCVVSIAQEDDSFTGNMLIDDVYLRSKGYSDEDLVKYRVDPNVEPPRILAMDGSTGFTGSGFKRGDVKQVEQDIDKSTI